MDTEDAHEKPSQPDVDPTDRDTDNNTQKPCENKVKNYDELLEKNCREFMEGKEDLPDNWNKLNHSEKLKIMEDFIRKYYPNVPESLVTSSAGTVFPVDDDTDPPGPPAWLDREKFDRGQRFARDNFLGILYSNGMSLFGLYSFADGLKPIIMTGKSSDPYTAFKRFLSTTNRVRHWFFSDPWTKGSPAYNDIRAVRRQHTNVRNKLEKLSMSEINRLGTLDKPMAVSIESLLDDFRESCPVAKAGQCPYVDPNLRDRIPTRLNQGEMAMTQFGFIGMPLLYPESFGIHYATDKDFEAFCHLWMGLGYLLGIEDQFNFCLGGLEPTRQRCRDFLEYFVKPNFRSITPEFEHMVRCVFMGINFYVPGTKFEGALLYLTDLIDIPMPRLRASMSYSAHLRYRLLQHIFHFYCRSDWVKAFLNKRVHTILDQACAYDKEKHKELQMESEKIVSDMFAEIDNKKSEKDVGYWRKACLYTLSLFGQY